jgi:hypothetical protein
MRPALLFIALGLCLAPALGCEAVAAFDRSKIPMPTSPAKADAGDDTDSGALEDAGVDAGVSRDAGSPADAGADAAALPDASGDDAGDDAG